MTDFGGSSDSQTLIRLALVIGYLRTGIPLRTATEAAAVPHSELVVWLNDDAFLVAAQKAMDAAERDWTTILMGNVAALATGLQKAENPGNTPQNQPSQTPLKNPRSWMQKWTT